MKESKEKIEALLKQYGSPLWVFDEADFTDNYHKLYSAMASRYEKYRVAYSFKTNYTPYICKIAKRLGAYAEVVSGMEYKLAKSLGYDDHEIIFNGPDKGKEGIDAFLSGSMVNADSLDELDIYCNAAEANPDGEYKIGLRVNLDIGQIGGVLGLLGHGGFISMRRFIQDARLAMIDGDLQMLKRIVAARERSLKGARSKIGRTDLGDLSWRGGLRLSYRFNYAVNIIREISEAGGFDV